MCMRNLAGGDIVVALLNMSEADLTIEITLAEIDVAAETWLVRDASAHQDLQPTTHAIAATVPLMG